MRVPFPQPPTPRFGVTFRQILNGQVLLFFYSFILLFLVFFFDSPFYLSFFSHFVSCIYKSSIRSLCLRLDSLCRAFAVAGEIKNGFRYIGIFSPPGGSWRGKKCIQTLLSRSRIRFSHSFTIIDLILFDHLHTVPKQRLTDIMREGVSVYTFCGLCDKDTSFISNSSLHYPILFHLL